MSSNDASRRRFLALAGSSIPVLLAGCTGGGSGGSGGEETQTTDPETTGPETTDPETTGPETTDPGMMNESVAVTVRIENVAATDVLPADSHTEGQVWITPGAFAVHTGENPIFTAGNEASVGLEALAEAGPPTGFPDQPGLADELGGMADEMGVVSSGVYTPDNTVVDPNDPRGEVPGAPPIAPGGAFEFEIEAEPGQRISFASMFVPSNDVFLSPGAEGIELWPEGGGPVSGDVTDDIALYDAGTEPNAAPGQGPDQAPAQSSPNQGDDEGGVVRLLTDVDDGHDYPTVDSIVRVTLSPEQAMNEGS